MVITKSRRSGVFFALLISACALTTETRASWFSSVINSITTSISHKPQQALAIGVAAVVCTGLLYTVDKKMWSPAKKENTRAVSQLSSDRSEQDMKREHDTKEKVFTIHTGVATKVGFRAGDAVPKVNADAYSIDQNNQIIGVYDGTGTTKEELLQYGADIHDQALNPSDMAKRISQILPPMLMQANGDKAQACEAFEETNNDILFVPKAQRGNRTGAITIGASSTTAIAHLAGNILHIYSLGDSAVYVARANKNPERIPAITAAHTHADIVGNTNFNGQKLFYARVELDLAQDHTIVAMTDGVEKNNPRLIEILQSHQSAQDIANTLVNSGQAGHKAHNKSNDCDDATAVVMKLTPAH